jgi:hypothetical protein
LFPLKSGSPIIPQKMNLLKLATGGLLINSNSLPDIKFENAEIRQDLQDEQNKNK